MSTRAITPGPIPVPICDCDDPLGLGDCRGGCVWWAVEARLIDELVTARPSESWYAGRDSNPHLTRYKLAALVLPIELPTRFQCSASGLSVGGG